MSKRVKTESNLFQEQPQDYEAQTDYYFDSYSHFGIHEEMLKDRRRTLAYKEALQNLDGQAILDIGCGTGILSLFAAKGGADSVTGVEMAGIAKYAKEIVRNNGYEKKITIQQGKLEDLNLEKLKVDGVVSEWMGYFLLYESMLDSVIIARDKYMKPGGKVKNQPKMYPDKAQMFLAPLEDRIFKEEKVNFWKSVDGFDYSPVYDLAAQEPQIGIVDSEQIIGTTCCIKDLDLEQVTIKELDFVSAWEVNIERDSEFQGLISWFDCWFTHGKTDVLLSTSPFKEATHWKQVVFYLQNDITVKVGDILNGSIAIKKNDHNPRQLDIKISYHHNGEFKESVFYKLA